MTSSSTICPRRCARRRARLRATRAGWACRLFVSSTNAVFMRLLLCSQDRVAPQVHRRGRAAGRGGDREELGEVERADLGDGELPERVAARGEPLEVGDLL